MKDLAGAEYASLLAELLADAERTKTSLESRASSIITLSGALVTAMLGFGAIAGSNGRKPSLPAPAIGSVSTALILIVAAAGLALLVTAPLLYKDVSTTEMERLVRLEHWIYEDRSEAARMVAKARVKTLRRSRRINHGKGLLLGGAILLEVLAIAFIALSVRELMS